MNRYQAPGVYFEWLNTQPAALQIQRTDITGFVGICQRGPLHSPQKIESWLQFTSIFGDCIPQAFLAYVVQGFFANGGRTCWVVRVADPVAARCAWANLPDENDNITLALRALTPGTWAHKIDATVLQGGSDRFSLTLRIPDGAQELWRDLTLDTAEALINNDVNGSRLVRAFRVQATGTSPEGRSLRTGRVIFQEGQDGLRTLLPAHFSGNGSPAESPWGLALLEDITEISILAMPDLMTKDVREGKTYQPPPRCDVILEEDSGAFQHSRARLQATAVGVTQPKSLSAPVPGRMLYEAKEKREERETDERKEATASISGLALLPASAVQPEYPPQLDETTIAEIQMRMVLQCSIQKNRVAVLDLPRANMLPTEAIKWAKQFDTSYAALYYPWLRVPDDNGRPGDVRDVPPSGHVAGVYARVESVFGVHKPPANELLVRAQDVSMSVGDVIHGLLNEQKINALRAYPGRGLRVAGARTLSSDTEWMFINVRRLLIMIERSIDVETQWIPFEPNNQGMWRDTERVISSFLNILWQRGMLDGAKAEEAYTVRCDETTNPPEETNQGRMICQIRLQPPWPAEYVIARIGRTESGSQVLEG